MAVAHATRLIRDGQRIRVHGIGCIEILHKHKEEIQIFEDQLDLKFRHWEIFQVALTG